MKEKRRSLLLAAGLLALSPGTLLAANKKPADKKKASKPAKAGKKKSPPKTAPQSRPVTTAENSILESAHPGSSATRLPPVKAPEPPALWRTFTISTTVKLPAGTGQQRLWLPLPMNQDTLYQRTLSHSWQGNFSRGSLQRLPDGDLEAFYCEWHDEEAPQLELITAVTTADRVFEISRRSQPPEREDILRRNLRATEQIPNEGDILKLAQRILGRIVDPLAQARALYDWVVDNSEYRSQLTSPGTGNIHEQIEQHYFGGRSADINGLFVSLCRAIGIPARRVQGRRIGSSRITSSLGITAGDATEAVHCRAEFYVPGYSWVPVDPSDVCRAIALENLGNSPKRQAIKKLLFGVWEMNWMAYNLGEDLTLPESQNTRLPFFTRPRLEGPAGILDGQNAADFQYRIFSQNTP